MPFNGVYRQSRVTAIKVKDLLFQLWLGIKSAPGKGKGQQHIYYNISRSPTTEQGWASYPIA